MEADARRSGRERTARNLHAQIRDQGFTGSYTRVTEFVRAWRGDLSEVTARSAYLPLTFTWGEAFQFGWSVEHVVIGDIYRKVLAKYAVERKRTRAAPGDAGDAGGRGQMGLAGAGAADAGGVLCVLGDIFAGATQYRAVAGDASRGSWISLEACRASVGSVLSSRPRGVYRAHGLSCGGADP